MKLSITHTSQYVIIVNDYNSVRRSMFISTYVQECVSHVWVVKYNMLKVRCLGEGRSG